MVAQICAVAAGGAIGAVGRYLLGLAMPAIAAALHVPGGFPIATFAANFLGCFAIGVLSVFFDEGSQKASGTWRLFAITGILGGFTTFSTFGLETVQLIERGAIGMAGANMAASLAACLAGVVVGRMLMRAIAMAQI